MLFTFFIFFLFIYFIIIIFFIEGVLTKTAVNTTVIHR